MLTHDHFERLCAAAVTGQITGDELSGLQEHMETCADCRDFVGDVRQVVGPALFEHAGARSAMKLPKGARERFIATAHSEGIPLGRKGPSHIRRSQHRKGIYLFAVVAFIALLGVLLYLKFLAGDRHPPSTTGKVIRPISIPDDKDDVAGLRREREELQQKVQNLQLHLRLLDSQLASSHEAVKEATSRRAELEGRLTSLENAKADMHKSLDDRAAEVAELKVELERLTSLKEADEIAIQADESELNVVRDKLGTLTSELQKSEHLSAISNDAKDIIVARNLHIVDVKDADENGKRQRPFGRIFYAEGKKLRFYAYDLADSRKLDAQIQFYVWGERQGTGGPVRTLGVFHNDSRVDGRWVLNFDDPNVLAEIDSVFVTVESDKRSVQKPTGKKILYAYLGDKPNHP